MKILHGIAFTVIAGAAVAFVGTESKGQPTCDHGGNHTIQVSAGPGGEPQLSYRGGSAESVHVCNGDQLQWVLTGPDRQFLVNFFSGAPFEGATERGSSAGVVAVQISASQGSYAYGVNFAGEPPMDPEIIVD